MIVSKKNDQDCVCNGEKEGKLILLVYCNCVRNNACIVVVNVFNQ